MHITKLHVVPNGDANCYALGDDHTWFCQVRMNGEIVSERQREHLQKMAEAVVTKAEPTVDPMTVAYIAFGFRAALAEGLVFDPDDFNGEIGLMEVLIGNAPALDAELQRRYGEHGLEPGGQPFVFPYEIAEPFGHKFAEMLDVDECAEAAPLIQKLFDEADPQFWTRLKKAPSGSTDDEPETAAAA